MTSINRSKIILNIIYKWILIFSSPEGFVATVTFLWGYAIAFQDAGSIRLWHPLEDQLGVQISNWGIFAMVLSFIMWFILVEKEFIHIMKNNKIKFLQLFRSKNSQFVIVSIMFVFWVFIAWSATISTWWFSTGMITYSSISFLAFIPVLKTTGWLEILSTLEK